MSIYNRKKNIDDGDNNNIFWTTMADLLLGLAIIFMTLFVLAITGFSQETMELQQSKIQAAQELTELLKEENIEAEVDSLTGNVKISDLQLFNVGSYQLSPKGKEFLNKFVPIYVNTIFEKPVLFENIENIIIEGHTDSQMFKDAKTPNEQFTRNMQLSLQRAATVQDYMFKTNYNKKNDSQLRKIVIVEGHSYSNPVLDKNGKEDYTKSRRVELKLRVKGKSISKVFGFDFGGN